MCGITGFFSTNKQFEKLDLIKMTSAIIHRGPDAQGYFTDGVCGLGHARLSILDLSEQANQPMYSADEQHVIVFNGEVYNFQELAKQIEYPLRTQSDTEVLVELFIKQYVKFVYQLNGMFAMAIYNRVSGELFLFRDRLGIKPLYYYWDESESGQVNFVFASEMKALLKLDQIDRELDMSAVSDFLHLGYIPAPKSIFKKIHKLPPGHWLKVSREGLHSEPYWELGNKVYDQATQERLTLLNKETEAKKQLLKLLQSSVQYRLISDVPLGVFLSGGIDSSTIAALASEASEQKINTFSIGFEEDPRRETPHAYEVAKHLDTHHHEFILSIKEVQDLIPSLIDIHDEPFADSSALPTYLISKLAREQVKVVLGGDGGDELFLGYGMYQWAERLSQGFWQNMRKPVAMSLGLLGDSKYQKASRLFSYPNRRTLASHIFSQEQLLFSRKELNFLLHQEMLPGYYQALEHNRELSPSERQALFDLEMYLPDDLLVKVDRATMRHGLEARVPFLDHRVVEFAVNLASHLKYRKKERKYLLKQILYDYLPKNLFERPKQGFSIPLVEWLQGDLNYLIEEYLSQRVIEQFDIVRYEPVAMMKQKFAKGKTFYYNRLWALIVLHQFLVKNF